MSNPGAGRPEKAPAVVEFPKAPPHPPSQGPLEDNVGAVW